jgi:hypothetical protein
MLDPDRSGTLVVSMVRVAVRGCVAMASSTAPDYDAGNARSAGSGCFKKVFLFQERRVGLQASSLGTERDYADMSNGPGYSGESDRRSVMSRANGYRKDSGSGNGPAQKARRCDAAKGRLR